MVRVKPKLFNSSSSPPPFFWERKQGVKMAGRGQKIASHKESFATLQPSKMEEHLQEKKKSGRREFTKLG